MICNRCGKEYYNATTCPYCDNDDAVRVMSREEATQYDGVTLEAGNNRETDSQYYANRRNINFKVYNLSSMSLWQKIILGLLLFILGIIATFAIIPLMIFLSIIIFLFFLFHRQQLMNWFGKVKNIYTFWRQHKG